MENRKAITGKQKKDDAENESVNGQAVAKVNRKKVIFIILFNLLTEKSLREY